jgi:hypothetical protein
MRNESFRVLAACCSLSALIAQERVAFITSDDKSSIKVITDGPARPVGQDERGKWLLRWLPGGDRLSYFVKDSAGAMARIVVIDLDGRILSEAPFRTPDQHVLGMRFVEDAEWLTDHEVRLSGSANPWNSEILRFNIDSLKESDWHIGGGDFHFSADGRHVAYLGLGRQEPENDVRDSIMLDDDLRLYPAAGAESHLRVLSGPFISEDSRRVAVLARSFSRGERIVVAVLSITGGDRELTWVGDLIAVGSGSGLFIVDPNKGTVLAPTAEMSERVGVNRRRLRPVQIDQAQFHDLNAREIAVWNPPSAARQDR